MSRPSILFVSHEASRTGAPVNLLRLLRWLKARTDQPFEILVGRDGPLSGEFAKLAKVHTPASLSGLGESGQRTFLSGFSLIYANSCWDGGVVESMPFGATPLVTHFHEMDLSVDALGARAFAAVQRRSDRFIACSQAGADCLTGRFRIPRGRVSVHYSCVDPSEVAAGAAGAETLRARLGIPAGAAVVSACGTVELRKGPDVFVRLGRDLQKLLGLDRNLHLLWVGQAKDPDLERFLAKDIARMGLEGRMRFVGEMASPHGLLALSDVFCVTAREEPWGMVMTETALMGIPSVCFEGAGGGVEFCAQGGGVAVPYLDTDAMAEQCARWIRNRAERDAVAAKGAESVRNLYSVEAVGPRWWKEVSGYLDRRPEPSAFRTADASLSDVFESWDLDRAPNRTYAVATVARQQARRHAQALAQRGNATEASELLFRAVKADAATKDLLIIREGLAEICDDMTRIDPARAQMLLGEAEKLARITHTPLEAIRANSAGNERRRGR